MAEQCLILGSEAGGGSPLIIIYGTGIGEK